MAIKIDGQDLLKKFIGWQEIVRIYKNGGEIRPNTVPPTPIQPVDEVEYNYSDSSHSWWTVVEDSNEKIITLDNFPNTQFASHYQILFEWHVLDGESVSWQFLGNNNIDTVSNDGTYIKLRPFSRDTEWVDIDSETWNILIINAETRMYGVPYKYWNVAWEQLAEDYFFDCSWLLLITNANGFRIRESLSIHGSPIEYFMLNICSSRAKITEQVWDWDIAICRWVYWDSDFTYSCSSRFEGLSLTLDTTNKTFEIRARYLWDGGLESIGVWWAWLDPRKYRNYNLFYL